MYLISLCVSESVVQFAHHKWQRRQAGTAHIDIWLQIPTLVSRWWRHTTCTTPTASMLSLSWRRRRSKRRSRWDAPVGKTTDRRRAPLTPWPASKTMRNLFDAPVWKKLRKWRRRWEGQDLPGRGKIREEKQKLHLLSVVTSNVGLINDLWVNVWLIANLVYHSWELSWQRGSLLIIHNQHCCVSFYHLLVFFCSYGLLTWFRFLHNVPFDSVCIVSETSQVHREQAKGHQSQEWVPACTRGHQQLRLQILHPRSVWHHWCEYKNTLSLCVCVCVCSSQRWPPQAVSLH